VSLDWFDDALCAQTDPDAFNPVKGGSTNRAKSICARCDVAVQCLDYALTYGPVLGVWAGTTGPERRAMKRDAA
jgi:WhiB family redox-sensing transcriptional regulator